MHSPYIIEMSKLTLTIWGDCHCYEILTPARIFGHFEGKIYPHCIFPFNQSSTCRPSGYLGPSRQSNLDR
jgi:hypothetical protein